MAWIAARVPLQLLWRRELRRQQAGGKGFDKVHKLGPLHRQQGRDQGGTDRQSDQRPTTDFSCRMTQQPDDDSDRGECELSHRFRGQVDDPDRHGAADGDPAPGQGANHGDLAG